MSPAPRSLAFARQSRSTKGLKCSFSTAPPTGRSRRSPANRRRSCCRSTRSLAGCTGGSAFPWIPSSRGAAGSATIKAVSCSPPFPGVPPQSSANLNHPTKHIMTRAWRDDGVDAVVGLAITHYQFFLNCCLLFCFSFFSHFFI